MSAVLSILNRNDQPVSLETVEVMLEASPDRAVDGQNIWLESRSHIALAHQHFWITPEELGEEQPLIDAGSRQVIAADVRLDNREDLIKKLEIDHHEGRRLSDAALILMAYRHWGVTCVDALRGDFAFVIWDKDEEVLFAARDVLGARGLCYYTDQDLCVVGSEVPQLLAHPAIKTKVNEDRIADYLAGYYQDHEDTFYKNIYHCPPGHCLLISAESMCKWRYWDIDPQARIRYKDDREYTEHFLQLLTEAVRSRLRTIGPVGISMSGGLDSTTLGAIASNLLPETGLSQRRLKSFSYVFDELTSSDERRYIQPVVDRYQLEATYIPCDDKWTLRDIAHWPHYGEYVMGDAYVWLPIAVRKAAQEAGCRLLLGGYYGDALVSGELYWAAGMMADYRLGRMAKLIRHHGNLLYWREDFLVNGLRFMLPQRLRMYYRRRRAPQGNTLHPGIHPRLAERANLSRKFYTDPPKRADFKHDKWHRYLKLTPNFWDQGASAVRSAYNRFGLELSTPYWDRRLVEFVMAIPADQLGHPQRSRRLQRNAAAGLLPREVCEQRQKTTLEPLFQKGLLDKERETAAQIMADPLIYKEQYVNADWLRQQLNGGRGWANKEHSYFLWKCLSLELWLNKVN